MERVYCRKCNSYRPFEHIYCYVCGSQLLKDKPKPEQEIKKGKCVFCGSEIPSHHSKYCSDPICKKLTDRLYVHNSYRKRKGLPRLEFFEVRYCKSCGRPLELNRQSNFKVKYCSSYCRRVAHAKVVMNNYYKVKEPSNGKATLS